MCFFKTFALFLLLATVSRDEGFRTSVCSVVEGGVQRRKPVVIGIYGPSCSGKTTIASELYRSLLGVTDPSIEVKATSGDQFFDHELMQDADRCPKESVNGHVWKNWESSKAMNFEDWTIKLKQEIDQAEHDNLLFLVVESFLIFASEEGNSVRDLIDIGVVLHITKEEQWKRRLNRALDLHKKEGLGNGTNYEVLQTYAKDTQNYELILRDAKIAYPNFAEEQCNGIVPKDMWEPFLARGYEWMKLYFDEVLWPSVASQKRDALEYLQAANRPYFSVGQEDNATGTPYPSQEDWVRAKVNELVKDIKVVVAARETSSASVLQRWHHKRRRTAATLNATISAM